MNKQRAKIALIPVLAGALWMVLREPSVEVPATRPRRPEVPIIEAGATPRAARKRELAEIVSFDPFAPPFGVDIRPTTADGVAAAAVEAAPALPLRARLRVEAILQRDGAFQAVIAGKVVRTGDLIDEGRYRVTAITADNVTFNRLDGEQNP